MGLGERVAVFHMILGNMVVESMLTYFCARASASEANLALEIHFPSVGGCLDDLVNGDAGETPVAEMEGGDAMGRTEPALYWADLA